MPSLVAFSQPLGNRRAKHLLRRACFNFSPEKINEFSALTPSQALWALSAPSSPKLYEPIDPKGQDWDDMHWTSSINLPGDFTRQGAKRVSISGWWWYNAFNEVSLEHKLTLFLHTCFTTSKDSGTGASTYFYDHLRLLQKHAFGNLKSLANKITIDNAMLFYLDNNVNNRWNPNENYAREFLELFTILKGEQKGDGDYTNFKEHDVQMAAQVFSGFKNKNDRSIIDADTGLPMGYINANHHVQDDKTFSSAFGNTTILGGTDSSSILKEHEDFVDMVFSQEATAISYIRKMYRFFLKSEWSESVETDIILPLSQDLRDNGFQLLPVLKKLLESEHFYDEDDSNNTDHKIGAIIKHPMQLWTEIISAFKVDLVDANDQEKWEEYYHYFFKNFAHNSCFIAAGFNMFAPDSVAGYPADYQEPNYDRQWFTSVSIIARYKYIDSLLSGKNLITGGGKFESIIDSVDYVESTISNPFDATTIVTEIAQYLYPEDISHARTDYFKEFLTGTLGDVYWTGAWGDYKGGDDTTARIRLNELLKAMVNAAEFQIM
jgi:uncharacterized protein (DUF1800 family)